MSEKDKANGLVGSFMILTRHEEVSKQCALICVDEIISACEYNNVENYNTDWWNRVKHEINNL